MSKAFNNVQKLNNIVDVTVFGAKGDGVTDDAPAVQAAIDAVAASGGGTVFFVNGLNYLFNNLVLLKTNVSLIGNGCTITVNPGNYTGAITRFYGVFSTVNLTSRPLTINWRLGTGVVAFENIVIDGFKFVLNRDGSVLSAGQILLSEMNAVRFEDARNCQVKNCQFVDVMTSANFNQSQTVFFVRSEFCSITDCYATNMGFFWSAECTATEIARCNIPVSAGTAIETVGGKTYNILQNYIGTVWAAVSSIGMNSVSSAVRDNRIAIAGLTGITLGHPPSDPTTQYGVYQKADYAVCEGNTVESGGSLTANHGYIGILVQGGDGIRINNNTVLALRKKAAYTDRAGSILVQPDTAYASPFVDSINISQNYCKTATVGVYVVRAGDFAANENYIEDCIAGSHFEITTLVPNITFVGNYVTDCDRAIVFVNGNMNVSGNYFANIANSSFSFACSRGSIIFNSNYMTECGAAFFDRVERVSYVGNTLKNATPITRAALCDNQNAAGTATIDLIEVHSNLCPGATDVFRINAVLNQTARNFAATIPIQYRSTSYNVGALPTSSSGLSAGDIWNDSNTVKVV